jgi:hypothetical protein
MKHHSEEHPQLHIDSSLDEDEIKEMIQKNKINLNT